MALKKYGEVAQILQRDQYPVAPHLHNPMMERVLADPEVILRFEKIAAEIKAVAPKANDFLYFSAVMMHAAEACLFDDDGNLRKDAAGADLSASWEKNGESWKWVCSDTNIRPYKNANNDIFPEEELLKAHKAWIGRPLCLDHKSSSVDSIRGVIVDTYYDFPKKRVIALCALDKLNYPDLARKIESKYATSVSMGTAVGRAICTDCGQVAKVEADFCDHMRSKSCYGEINIDLKPIELSIVVNGADPRARIKHIIAAANSIAKYVSAKEKQISKLSMHEMVDPDAISAIKKDLEGIMEKLTELEGSAEKVENIEEAEESGNYPHEGETAEASSKELNVKLASLHKELKKLQGDMDKLQTNSEDTNMTTKEAYFQGGGGVNEPTPGKPKYEKEDSDSIRLKEDKQMVGAPPFPGVGSVDGLYGDDLKKKELVLRAEKEERALRRQAAIDRAKASIERQGYFQGGGGVNEPTPGKPKYEKEDSDSIRDKEDKQMVGAPPFPDVGSVDGLYGDDLKKKEMLLRATLKGRFVKAANPDGTENKGESRWHVFADDKIILTATVNELTNGKADVLYDSVASKPFGKKILGMLRSTHDVDKVAAILKGGQAPAAPAAPAAAPAPAAPAPAGDMGAEMPMGEEAPTDAGGTGDPKEELPALLDEAENIHADIRSSVDALLEEGDEGLEGFDELSEGMGAEASNLVALNKLQTKVGKALLVGMKQGSKNLGNVIEELRMAKHVYDNRHRVDASQRDYVDSLTTDACRDTKKILASCYGLMRNFVKYADGTKALMKRADAERPNLTKTSQEEWQAMMRADKSRHRGPAKGDPLVGLDGKPIAMSEQEERAGAASRGPARGPKPKSEHVGTPAAPGDTTGLQQALEYNPFAGKEKGRGAASGISTGEGGTAGTPHRTSKSPGTLTKERGTMPAMTDDGDIADLMLQDPDDPTRKWEVVGSEENMDTKEGRAARREKLAAKAMKWHPLLQEAHPSGGETTQLDVKPTGDLAKVERLDETNKAMMDVATAPPRVRQAAEEIQRLVALGKINPDMFDELIANGLDKDAVSYWKKYWGQAKSEGSQFASELVKEYQAKKKAEEEEAYRVKVSRSYDLAYDMVRRGMLADDRAAVNSQVNEFLSLSDRAFDSYKRFTEKQSIQKLASGMPQVGAMAGLLGQSDITIPAPQAAPTNLAADLEAAFANMPFKGRMF